MCAEYGCMKEIENYVFDIQFNLLRPPPLPANKPSTPFKVLANNKTPGGLNREITAYI